MNVSIDINGNDVSNYVVSYERESKICSGIGMFRVVLSLNCFDTLVDDDVMPWRSVVLSEGGVVVKRYFINSSSKNLPDYSLTIDAQDGSKYLIDHYISDITAVTDLSTTKYWITEFLEEVGLSYSFTATGYGNLLPNDTPLGAMTSYDQIMQLLQLSAWYMYFDADNTCIIGKLNKDISTPTEYFDKTDIISIHTHTDDSKLRNRAVVWGKGDPLAGTWVFADIYKITAWNYDANDKRAVVLSNPYIPNVSTAYSMANTLLDEYTKLDFYKVVVIHGARNISIGDIVFLDTSIFSGSGLVTTVGTEMSESGLITKMTLDERCPRLLGYYGFLDYVYVGTNNNGVWRKHIDITDLQTWENYSTGLDDLCITDLYKNNGIMSCVTSSGELYRRRDGLASWLEVTIPELSVITYSGGTQVIPSGLMARAVTQDRFTNNIHVVVDNFPGENVRDYGVTISGLVTILTNHESNYCWVLDVSPYTGYIVDEHQVAISGYDGFVGFDIDNDGKNDYVSVAGVQTASGIGGDLILTEDGEYEFGTQNANQFGSYIGTGLSPSNMYTSWGGIDELDANNIHHSYTYYIVPETLSFRDDHDNREFSCIKYAAPTSTNYYFFIKRYTYVGGVPTAEDITSSFNVNLMRSSSNKNCYITKKVDDTHYSVYVPHIGEPTTILYRYDLDFDNNTMTEVEVDSYSCPTNGDRNDFRTGGLLWYVGSAVKHDHIYIGWYSEYDWVGNSPTSISVLLLDYDTNLEQITELVSWEKVGGSVIYHQIGESTVGSVKLDSNENPVILGAFHKTIETGNVNVYSFINSDITELATGLNVFQGFHDDPAISYQYNTKTYGFWQYYEYTTYDGYYCTGVISILNGVSSWTLYSNFGSPFPSHPQVQDYSLGFSLVTALSSTDSIIASIFPIVPLTQYYCFVNPITFEKGDNIIFPESYHPLLLNSADDITGLIYFLVWDDDLGVTWKNKIIGVDSNGTIQKEILCPVYLGGGPTTKDIGLSYGNFIIKLGYYTGNNRRNYSMDVSFIWNQENVLNKPAPGGIRYLVLKRDGDTFTPVISGLYDSYRADLSESTPLAVVTSGEWGMGFIETTLGNSVHLSDSIDTVLINDFRYTTVNSGTLPAQKFLYTKENDLYSLDITNLDIIDYQHPSLEYTHINTLGKLETSNHQLPHQYLFISTETISGVSSFLQENPTISGGPMEYSTGLPLDLINIIRLDDKI